MAETRRAGPTGVLDPKDLKKYLGVTKRKCTTCGKSVMYIKIKLDSTTTLECPNCDQVENIPKGLEKFE
jgi:predicted RNA-binding Zn-ribbon protein involved in translation (DUF1610 family)